MNNIPDRLFVVAKRFGEVNPETVRESSVIDLDEIESEYRCLNDAVRDAWEVSDTHFRKRMKETARLVYYHMAERPTKAQFVDVTEYTVDEVRAEFPDWESYVESIEDPMTAAGYAPVVEPPEDAPTWVQKSMEVYGPNWLERREQVLERDGEDCRVCEDAEDKGLHVHHITPRSEFVTDGVLDYFSANKQDNLISLCPECHVRLEGKWVDKDPDEFARIGKQFLGYAEIRD